MKVFSFQFLYGGSISGYDAQDVKIYTERSLDKLVTDYHQTVDSKYGGNIEMFMEEYDGNSNYENSNYPDAYLEMINHPHFSKLSDYERRDYDLPIPLSVEKILSFNLSPGKFKTLLGDESVILVCHKLIEGQLSENKLVYSVQTEAQIQRENYSHLFEDNVYSSLEVAIEKFNQQLVDDFEINREYFQMLINSGKKPYIQIPEFSNYQEVYLFGKENGLIDELYEPLTMEHIEKTKRDDIFLYKACRDEFGGYWVGLIAHQLI